MFVYPEWAMPDDDEDELDEDAPADDDEDEEAGLLCPGREHDSWGTAWRACLFAVLMILAAYGWSGF